MEADEIITICGTDTQMVEKINKGARMATGDFLFLFGDRGVMKKGWYQQLQRALEGGFSGVVSFGENTVLAGGATRDYYEHELKANLLHPEYIHYHGDQELGERARLKLKYKEILGYLEIVGDSGGVNDYTVEHDKNLYEFRCNKKFFI